MLFRKKDQDPSLFLFLWRGMTRAGIGAPLACGCWLSLFVELAAGTATTLLLLFADGMDGIPEQKDDGKGNETIGYYRYKHGNLIR